jgi:hypothetical protein
MLLQVMFMGSTVRYRIVSNIFSEQTFLDTETNLLKIGKILKNGYKKLSYFVLNIPYDYLLTHSLTYLLIYLLTYLTYSLTHSLTTWSRVLMVRLTDSQPVKKFPAF